MRVSVEIYSDAGGAAAVGSSAVWTATAAVRVGFSSDAVAGAGIPQCSPSMMGWNSIEAEEVHPAAARATEATIRLHCNFSRAQAAGLRQAATKMQTASPSIPCIHTAILASETDCLRERPSDPATRVKAAAQ